MQISIQEEAETVFSGEPCTIVWIEGATLEETTKVMSWLSSRNDDTVTLHLNAGTACAGPGDSGLWEHGLRVEFEVEFEQAKASLAAFLASFPVTPDDDQ